MKKTKYFWFLLFCMGLVVGAVCASVLVDKNTAINSAIMIYLENFQNTRINNLDVFIQVCIRRLLEAAALAGVVYMFRTTFFFHIITVLLGTAFGYVMGILTMIYSLKSGLMMILLLMPQYLFYIPVYMLFLKLADMKSEADGGYLMERGGHKIVGIVASAVFIMVLAGSLAESYVNPLFVKKIVKIF